MYLKSVEMQGFKSFADKIYLNFNPGITAIVGPNGSGKSNISDAIRWVMGEQSVKSLRGSRMEDVIFSGTEVRKPHGFAEVSLVLDNSQHIFPVDYEEVTVTRRVYRSGEGEYFINKNACRLKDIHELFMDTGLGREGYSIVGQGKIDEILSNKSEDRRKIFEEAAGITKYKYRKNEAERKLERTNENLTRVTDIMRELEGQLEPLRIQSEKAKKYLNLRDQLKGIEVSASVASIEKYREELKKTDKDYDDVSESIAILQKEADETENAINKLYADSQGYDEETERLRAEQKEASEMASEGTNSINLSLANIDHFGENIERIRAEIEKSNRGISQLDSLIEEYTETHKTLCKAVDAVKEKKAVLEEKLSAASLEYSEKSEKIEEIKSLIIEKTSQINSLQSKITNYNILIENFKFESENANLELSKQAGGYEELVSANKAVKSRLQVAEEELAKLKCQEEEITNQLKNTAALGDELVAKKNDALAELNRKMSKKSVLEDMENDFEGYGRSVKAVMSQVEGGVLKNYKIYGPLSKLVATDKKYVTAIETALFNVSQNIVTETEQDAKAAINYLKQNKLGRATFMPVSTVKERTADISDAEKMPGYIAVAKDLVKYDEHYEGIVGSVLGATLVVDNIDNAIAMAAKCGHKIRIVTLEGEVMQPGGAMSGGSTGKNSGFLSRKAEIDNLVDEIEKLKVTIRKINEDYEKNTEASRELTEKAERARSAVMETNQVYAVLKAETDHSDKYLAESEEKRDALLKNIQTTEMRTREINEDIILCNENISTLEAEIVALRDEVQGKQGQAEDSYDTLQKLQDHVLEMTIEENAKLKDAELQKERLDSVLAEKQSVYDEISEKQQQIDGFAGKIEEIRAEIEKMHENLDEIGKKSIDIDKRIDELSNLRKDADASIRKIQEGVKEVHEKLFALGQQKVKVEEKKLRIEGQLDGIFAHLWEEYELTYSEAVKLRSDEEINLTEANKKIAELKGKIKSLGNINIDAIEEYKNVKERFDFLSEQTRDLEKAKGELESLIAEMLEIMQKQFSEQFAVISKNFNSVFRELFGGGQATLSLADPDDILESGVEIEAQPPGKKLQNLSLLSGGEKAFTAIALLFAILKVRPTPFCILDEIEAALDDVNVYRYADYLKKFSEKTQFIVVTHRRGTMESANILYGVTMQEKGISKLLSLNIDEVTE